MTHNRSSSNRTSSISDAVIVRGDQSLGPLRLPFRRAEDFVAHFNRTYMGLGIEVIENSEAETGSARLDANTKDSGLSEKTKSQPEEPESGTGP